jgi:hypothetical protein
MPFRNFADPHQLSIMTQALDRYCERRAISSKEEREEIAAMVIALFSGGAGSVEEIAAGIERIMEQENGSTRADQQTG